MKKVIASVAGLICLTWAMGAVPCHAAEGKDLFSEKCGQCHRPAGEGPVFAPTKYAGIQWERFFAKNKHKRKKDIGSVFSEDELKSIKQYLVDHAADSDHPEAVGLR